MRKQLLNYVGIRNRVYSSPQRVRAKVGRYVCFFENIFMTSLLQGEVAAEFSEFLCIRGLAEFYVTEGFWIKSSISLFLVR